MHDIWNPWHGFQKTSEGCEHCYMFYLDRVRADRDGSEIYKTKSGFNYPLQKDRSGRYKIRSGEMIRVCMNSDFFLPEADECRSDAWEMPVVSSSYWNIKHEGEDRFGEKTLRTLAENMVKMLG